MKFVVLLTTILLNSTPALADVCTAKFPRVQQDIVVAEANIQKLNDAFSKVPGSIQDRDWVKAKLGHMFEVDQYIRNLVTTIHERSYTDAEKQCAMDEFVSLMIAIDLRDTADMKTLLTKYDWIRISLFGEVADNQAWLIVQHADQDPDFQQSVLKTLENLWPLRETSSQNYAYLFDRVAASWNDLTKRRLQRYGTQGQCTTPGNWEPLPLEDEMHLDGLRRTVGLGPFAEYKKMADGMCP
ncbi:MAG TPA: DUF6624 domain-containing protein [Bdellovibrionales bacterium]|jgi:hypothetical protein|nr:DUF6624 domain-containing protein [Bdellovibrionales bacterium]